jgi:hypothetical protein
MRLTKAISIVAAITLATLAISMVAFRSGTPDCSTAQMDAQCRLATFLPILYSFAAAGAACLVSTLYFVLRHLAASRKQPLPSPMNTIDTQTNK